MRFSVQVGSDLSSTSSEREERKRQSVKRLGGVLSLLLSLAPSSMDPSMPFLIFSPSLPIHPKTQPLSSSAAERFDLHMASGSTVADLYEAAEERLGECENVFRRTTTTRSMFFFLFSSSFLNLDLPTSQPRLKNNSFTGVPRGALRLATASRTLLRPSAATPIEEEEEEAAASSSSSSAAAPAPVLFAFASSSSSLSLRGGMMIKVKTLTGKEVEVDIEPSDTVARIKERVEEKEGIPPAQQRLIFAGKQMADEKQARDYNMEGGSVLHLVLALRGGCC